MCVHGVRPQPDAHGAAGGRVLERVVEHVPEHALQGDGVGAHLDPRALHGQLDAHLLAVRLAIAAGQLAHDLHEVHHVFRNGEPPLARAGRVHELGHEVDFGGEVAEVLVHGGSPPRALRDEVA